MELWVHNWARHSTKVIEMGPVTLSGLGRNERQRRTAVTVETGIWSTGGTFLTSLRIVPATGGMRMWADQWPGDGWAAKLLDDKLQSRWMDEGEEHESRSSNSGSHRRRGGGGKERSGREKWEVDIVSRLTTDGRAGEIRRKRARMWMQDARWIWRRSFCGEAWG